MKTETTILKSEAVFSDDRKHRLLLRKEWDKDKKSAMVIMINPNTADTFNMDMTTMLVLNNLYKLGFGSVNIVNLYTRIMPKLSLRFLSDEDLLDEEADKVLKQYAAVSDTIIIAWGSVGNNSQRVRDRQEEILAMLSTQKDRIYQIGLQSCHPLTPTVRHSWVLEPDTEEFRTFVQQYIKQITVYPYHFEVTLDKGLSVTKELTETISMRRGELYAMFDSRVRE